MKNKIYLIISSSIIVATLVIIVVLLVVGNSSKEINVDYIYDFEYYKKTPEYKLQVESLMKDMGGNVNAEDIRLYEIMYTEEFIDKVENSAWQIFHEDVIQNSTGACIATLLSYEEDSTDSSGVWTFELNELLYGEVPDKKITVIHRLTRADYTAFEFQVGKKYIITLTHSYSSLYNCERYSFVGTPCINLTDMKDFKWYRGNINIESDTTERDFVHYFKEFAIAHGFKNA